MEERDGREREGRWEVEGGRWIYIHLYRMQELLAIEYMKTSYFAKGKY